MNKEQESENDSQENIAWSRAIAFDSDVCLSVQRVDNLDWNHYVVFRTMSGVLSEDDYDELRDF